ncbi:MAG: hypothetical protein ACR2QV_04105 [Gammaproteobacteria bacterium]
MTLLRFVFVGQLLVMLPALGLFLGTPSSLGTVYLVVLLTPVALATSIYALWQAWHYPPRRALALGTLATAVVVMATPFVRDALGLGTLPGPALAAGVVAAAAVGLIMLLAARRRWDNERLFRASGFNYALLIALAAALLLIWVPPIAWLASRGTAAEPVDVDALRLAAIMYLPIMSTPGLIVMIFSLLYAPAGLFRNPSARLLHLGQLALALLLMASLGIAAFALLLAVVNPG